ncbi:NADP-dependent oxidoreductase [Alicyclobacillus shizuokensis]|uniref:NADP-dependent oxidoreductase n=1 Tax=Alicyclobacillus shizuokensis TaxID=392014 RepID=UPI0008353663|nr:NADP-dependent oxidoreductase [Alicyclobacillus shizuokensis]MCL6627168.1 NADP-dependent oxidoreductase [Alicyclobacillus shizuokensis]
MRAVYIEAYGGRDQLKYGELPRPAIGADDVLIEVHAAGVNPVDWKIREGYLKQRLNYTFPLILGWDAAGVVVETGWNVTQFRVGDKVFTRPAIERNGSYAEYLAAPERLVAPIPKNISFEEAASIPLAGLTAWQALVDTAQVRAGDKVLVHAGAGGVGVYAIQIAKAYGAYVATTVSERNLDLVRSLGADVVIDYVQEDFVERVRDYDIVLDTMGGDVQRRSYDVLKPGGILVSIINPPDPDTAAKHRVRAEYFFLEPDGKKLAKLGELVEQGRVRPVVGHVFPLEQAAKAHELSESHHARGKIVLQVR